MATSKTTKKRSSKKKTPSKKTSTQKASQSTQFKIGDKLSINGTYADTIKKANLNMPNHQQSAGSLLIDFLRKAQPSINAYYEEEAKLKDSVLEAAKSNNLDLGPDSKETWNFNLSDLSFTRTR